MAYFSSQKFIARQRRYPSQPDPVAYILKGIIMAVEQEMPSLQNLTSCEEFPIAGALEVTRRDSNGQ